MGSTARSSFDALPPALNEPQRQLVAALQEGLSFPAGGEVVIRSGELTGRAFICCGKLAWVTASSLKRTLSEHLIHDHGIPADELKAVFAQCKASGANFAETVVAWGLMDREKLRAALLLHIARALLELLDWPEARSLVVASNRRYHGSLMFSPGEVFAAAALQTAPPGQDRVQQLAAFFADEETVSPPPQASEVTPVASLQPPDTGRVQTRESQMALESYLAELKEIKGYKAAGIMHYTGEMLASDWTGSEVDVNLVGATFNDIFRSSHSACQKIGLEACTETVISTPKGQVIMRCSGVNAASHFHMLTVLTSDGNQALAKMRMEKMVPKIMAELV